MTTEMEGKSFLKSLVQEVDINSGYHLRNQSHGTAGKMFALQVSNPALIPNIPYEVINIKNDP